MTIEGLRPQERGVRQSELVITANDLWQSNHSDIAEEIRSVFVEKTSRGEVIGSVGCADPRMWTPGDISYRNVAGAMVPPELVVTGKASRAWISASHFDGDTVEKGVMPKGCGGLATKAALGDRHVETPGIQRYSSEAIPHPDPIIQAIRTAEAIAAISGKPTIATAQDHLTSRVYPLAYFIVEDGEELSRSAVHRRYLNKENYDPQVIYSNGIPFLRPGNIPDVFQEILERNRQQALATLSSYPDLRDMQKVIDPRIVLLTTDIRSARMKYPTFASIPGSMFKINVPRQQVGGSVSVDRVSLDAAFDQLSYPISHSVLNHGDTKAPFHHTDTIIVETADMRESRRIAGKIARISWGKEWLTLPDRKIIPIQVNDGVVNDIDELRSA